MKKYSSDGRVEYDPTSHTYKLGERFLTGVTSFIGNYKQKFDAEKVATAYVLKHGGDIKELMASWKLKGETSIIQGHAVHSVFETFVKTGKIEKFGISPKEAVAEKFIKDYFHTNRLHPVEAESIIYDEEMGIASQIDLVAKNTKDDHFVFDWKTNNEIKYDSWNKYMLPPFHQIPDCSYYHYSLQVKFYKELCRDYHISNAYIVHIGENDYSIIKPYEIKASLRTLLGLGGF